MKNLNAESVDDDSSMWAQVLRDPTTVQRVDACRPPTLVLAMDAPAGLAEVFARARRRQLAQQWRRRTCLRLFSPWMRVVFRSWRLEADDRIRAMMLLRRWREPRMLQARRRRAARVLIRRSLDEWFMHMLVCRASRGGLTYAFGYWRGDSWQYYRV